MKKATRESLRFNLGQLHQIDDEFILIDIFLMLQERMEWFRKTGTQLLRKPVITFREWHMLNYRIHALNLYLPCPAIATLHLKIISKAALSLVELSKKVGKNQKRRKACEHWFRILEDRLSIDRPDWADSDPFKFGTGLVKRRRWAVVEDLIPVAQNLRSEHSLKRIASLRYEGVDHYSKQIFFAANKTW